MPKFSPSTSCGCCGCRGAAWVTHHSNISPKYHYITVGLQYCPGGENIGIATNLLAMRLYYDSESGGYTLYKRCPNVDSLYSPYFDFSGLAELTLDLTNETIDGMFPTQTWLKKARVQNFYISGIWPSIFPSYSSGIIDQSIDFSDGEGLACGTNYCNTDYSGYLPPLTLYFSGGQPTLEVKAALSLASTISMVHRQWPSGKSFVINTEKYIPGTDSTSFYNCHGFFNFEFGDTSGGTGILSTLACNQCSTGYTQFNTYFRSGYDSAYAEFYDYPLDAYGYNVFFCNPCSGIMDDVINLVEGCLKNDIFTPQLNEPICECKIDEHLPYPDQSRFTCANFDATGQIGVGDGALTEFRSLVQCTGTFYGPYAIDNYAIHEFSGHRLPNHTLYDVTSGIGYSYCGSVENTYPSSITGMFSFCYTLPPEFPILGKVFISKIEVDLYSETHGLILNCIPSPVYPTTASPISIPPPCVSYNCIDYDGQVRWPNYAYTASENREYALYIAYGNDGRHMFGELSKDNFFKVDLPSDSYSYDIDEGSEIVVQCGSGSAISIPCTWTWLGAGLSLNKTMSVDRIATDTDFDFSFITLAPNPIDSCEP